MKQRNKGFTLVELLVVVAVFSIVGAAITAFILSSQKSYARGANEVDIQEEAQLVSNQLQDLIIDTSLGISYRYIVDDSGTTITDYMNNDAGISPDGELTQKELWIYNKDAYYKLLWDKDSKELYYVEYVKSPSGSYQLADGMVETGVILGEYVKEFSVDLSQVASSRIVSLSMTFQKMENGVDYDINKTISLRNDILTNRDRSEVYASADIELQPTPDGIKLSPTSSTLWPGETLKYTASLTCSRGGLPSQNATWTIADATSATTAVVNGRLTVGTDEKGNSEGKFTVTASADGFDYDASAAKPLAASATVNLKLIEGIYMDEDGFAASPVCANGTYIFRVHFTGNMIDGLSMSECGGINATLATGSENASITSIVEDTTDGYAYITVVVNDTIIGDNPTISLRLSPKREGFTDVSYTTGTYSIATAAQILTLEKNDEASKQAEWIRMENREVEVSFNNETLRGQYVSQYNSNRLKYGYYIRYTYEVRDSSGNVTSTAYYNSNNRGNSYNAYIKSGGGEDRYSIANVELTENVDFHSGSVWVTAELYSSSNTLIGSSNTISYTIPEVQMAYSLSGESSSSYYKQNMNVYITLDDRYKTIYYKFLSGISNEYEIDEDLFTVTASAGTVNQRIPWGIDVDDDDNTVSLTGVNNSTYYSTADMPYINISYNGMDAQAVKVYMMSTNINDGGRWDYWPYFGYIPSATSEWITISGENYYYISSSKRVHIERESNSDVAYYQTLERRGWSGDNDWYVKTYNTVNARWQ